MTGAVPLAAALSLAAPPDAPAPATPARPPPVVSAVEAAPDGYAFRGEVTLPGSPACLLEVVYRVEHVRRFAGDYRVTLVREGEGWNEVGFGTSGPFHDVELVYRRTLLATARRVEFALVGGRQQGVLPRVLASGGAYALEPADGGWRLAYQQRVSLGPGLLRGLYVRRATAESRAFMERLRDHALRTCP